MAYVWLQYEFPTQQLFHKQILWANQNCNVYFAFKKNITDAWTYYSGNASNALDTGRLLTLASSESNAQTNHLTTDKDSNGKTVAILPTVVQAKYARVYVETGAGVTIHEWRPSTYFTADEIVSGELHITDAITGAPLIRVTKSNVDRVKVGNIVGSTYGIAGYNEYSATIFELSDAKNSIAGWDFTATRFSSNDVLIANTGRIRAGADNNIIQIDSQDSDYRLWVGNVVAADAPFKVTKAGKLYAQGADISGTLAASSITAREIATRTITYNNIVINTLTATEFAASCITANKIRGGDFGTLILDSGKILINAASGLAVNTASGMVIKDGGDIVVEQGGDIILRGGAAGDPSLIKLEDTTVPSEIRYYKSGDENKYWSIQKTSANDSLFVGPSTSLIKEYPWLLLGKLAGSGNSCYQVIVAASNAILLQVNDVTAMTLAESQNTLHKYTRLTSGVALNCFSNNATLANNSATAVPTEKAVRSYVDNNIKPENIISLYDDFVYGYNDTVNGKIFSDLVWGYNGVTIVLTSNKNDNNHKGHITLNTGTGATGWASIDQYPALLYCSASNILENEFCVNLESLIGDYILYVGLGDQVATLIEQNNGIYFKYSQGIHSGNWGCCTAKNSNRTNSDSGVAVTSDAWHKLKTKWNGADSILFYINEASVCTLATNICMTSLNTFSPLVKLAKASGESTIYTYIDYFFFTERVNR